MKPIIADENFKINDPFGLYGNQTKTGVSDSTALQKPQNAAPESQEIPSLGFSDAELRQREQNKANDAARIEVKEPVTQSVSEAPQEPVQPEPVQTEPEPEQDTRRGFARLVPAEKPNKDTGGALRFVNKGQDAINDTFKNILVASSSEFGRGFTVQSGYRPASHPVEARKKKPGQHSHRTAADISMAGMNEDERVRLVQTLRANGVQRFGGYSNMPDMLHVDMLDMKQGDEPWFMFNTSNRNMKNAPRWLKTAQQMVNAPRAKKLDPVIGNSQDDMPDPLGLYPKNPTQGAGRPVSSVSNFNNVMGISEQPQEQAAADEAPATVDPMDQQISALNKDAADRYEAMTEEQYAEFKKKFDADQPYFITDLAKMVVGGTVTGTASAVQGLGRLNGAFNAKVLNPIFGTDFSEGNHLSVPSEWVKKYGEGIKSGVSQATKDAIAGTDMSGNILQPSTWSMGENPSARGLLALTADVFGGMVPILAAGFATGGLGAVVTGGAQSAGGAEDRAHEIIDGMAAKEGVLEKQSPFFRELVASGKSREEAIKITKDAAANVASLMAAPIGGAGGFLTAKLAHPATNLFAQRGAVAAIGGRAGISAGEEGSQEVMESVAGTMGVNQAVGTDVDPMENTFADFVMGAMAGGTMGAGSGALSRMRNQNPDAAPAEQGGADPVTTSADNLNADPKATDPSTEATATQNAQTEPAPAQEEVSNKVQRPRYIINDPADSSKGLDEGQSHGQVVEAATDQSKVPDNMIRVIYPDGRSGFVGRGLLELVPPSSRDQSNVRQDMKRVVLEDGRYALVPSETQSLGKSAGGAVADPQTQQQSSPSGQPTAPVEQGAPIEQQTPAAKPAPAPRAGSLTDSLSKTAGFASLEYVVNDPSKSPDGESGELHGQTIMVSANQFDVPQGMVRVLADGSERVIKSSLLTPMDQAGDIMQPLGSDTGKALPAENRPKVGSTVNVTIDGIAPFTGTIDQYTNNGDVVVTDSLTGELLQVPENSIRSKEQSQSAETLPVRDSVDMDAVPPSMPIAGETIVTKKADPEKLVRLSETDETLKAGSSVIVDHPAVGRFTAKIEAFSDDGTKQAAVVKDTKGNSVEVPFENLYIDGTTKAESEQERIKENPPIDRDIDKTDPLIRMTPDKKSAMRFPNDFHAQLYDIGKERHVAKKLSGVSSLDMDTKNISPEQLRLAKQLRISDRDFVRLAESYRQSVESSRAKTDTKLPLTVHSVDADLIKQMREEHANNVPAEPAVQPASDQHWYDALSEQERARLLEEAKVKRSPKFSWEKLNPAIHDKLTKANAEKQVAAPVAQAAQAEAAPIEQAAVNAATHPDNNKPEPTQAQKEAGNYAKSHVRMGGLDFSIENPVGSKRSGVDSDGKAWSIDMKSHYGYIRGTEGRDKDHIDTFIKQDTSDLPAEAPVFVIDQKNPATGRFDEHKVMLGYDNAAEARAAYMENYTADWKGLGEITETNIGQFKDWLAKGDTKTPFAPKWFGSREKAEAYMAKNALGDSHSVVENGKRFEVQPVDNAANNSAPVAPANKAPSAKKKIPLTDRLENYFQAGRIVPSYFGQDKVLSFSKFSENDFSVQVVAVNKDGSPIAREQIRNHSTVPAEKFLEAYEKNNPVPERGKAQNPQFAQNRKFEEQTQTANEKAPKADNSKQFADNKLFTADKAAAARARMKSKLNQLNSGLDPEMLIDGITLTGAHIEAGLRNFSQYASTMIEDFGDNVTPYLLSFWEGVRYYPSLDTEGMTSPEESAKLHKLLAQSKVDNSSYGTNGKLQGSDLPKTMVNNSTEPSVQESKKNEPSELDQPRAGSLERTPAKPVQGTESGRPAGTGTERSGRADVSGNEPASGQRAPDGRSMADGAGEVSTSAGRREPAAGRSASDTSDAGRRAERKPDNEPVNGKTEKLRAEVDPEQRVTPKDSGATPAHNRADDYTITDSDALGSGGAKTKFKNNIAAIKLLRELETQNRSATRAEQAVLAKWVGWGGLQTAFHREDGSIAKGWENEASDLKALLAPDEYKAAQSSTRNAHYTSPEVVGAIWDAVSRLGFKAGRALEPSLGAGNFLGLAPANLRGNTRFTGAELDPITGGIAKHLYPAANIQAPIGFQDVVVPNNYFDIAIGNPPFGSERLYDKSRKELKNMSIHNFFFAKSVDALRPKGVLAMVITNSFMDAQNTAAREYIADRADLLGAIRLPNNAFLKNAGTEVTTDIIILQKRESGEPAKDRSWTDVSVWKDKEGRNAPLNKYFVQNPDMMLGDFGVYGTMYRPDQTALVARPDQNTKQLLDQAIAKLPENVMPDPVVEVQTETVHVPLDPKDVAVGSMFLDPKGEVHIRAQDHIGETRAKPAEFATPKAKERAAGMIRIRDTFMKLRRAQITDGTPEKQIENLRSMLNKQYDAFVEKHGAINQQGNRHVFIDDPTWAQLAALEDKFDKGVSKAVSAKTGEATREPSAQKAAIFSKRTQFPYVRPTSAKTAKDALAMVMNERGRIDPEEMSRLTGRPESELMKELGALVFQTPDGRFEPADLYLSGNVKKKLAQAEQAAAKNPEFKRNVIALRDVIPADIEVVDIDVKAGSPWVPANHVAAFVDHVTASTGSKAVFSKGNTKWSIEARGANEAAQTQWGTGRASIRDVINAALNATTLTIYDRYSDGKTEINRQETDAANTKVEAVKNEWRKWIWEDEARRTELGRIYNDTYNTDVETVYNGAHLTLPNKVGDDVITLRPHQKSFVWRVLQSSTALADHTVGAGKTFAAIAAIMELRRTGMAQKPMLVVPNHLVGQWAADFVKLYPNANILAATKKDFEKENRKKLFARVAAGDWDAVIVAHSSFGRIGVDPVFEAEFIQQQINDIEISIAELREADGKSTRNVKQLTKARDTMETKLKKLMDSGSKDTGMTFEEMGVDGLFVDEAHEFKNLGFATSMTRVAGLGNPTGSGKAADLYVKIQSVKKRTGGRNIVFLTGTPLSNTMAEMFTMQRYLDYSSMKEMGIAHFDAWARVFGEVVSDWELSPSGQYKLNSRFSKFVNMPELMQRYRAFADVITNDDIKRQLAEIGKTLPLPKVKGGKPQNVVVERSDDQADFIGVGKTDDNGNLTFPEGSLVWRAENLPKKAEKGADNMLKIMSDARKAALDMRLINPALPDVAGSKVHRAADEMKRLYDKWDAKKGTQLVFIDLSTPKSAQTKARQELEALIAKADEGDEAAQEKLNAMSPDEFMALDSTFSVYDDLKQKLINRGIPEKEIAYIHDANTDARKEELFSKVRAGTVRVLLGSTAKMGAGTNVQNRLIGLHHLDAPWRPSDLEQRDGRGIRQGNELYNEDPEGFEIEILRYATKNTLDARQWQTIEGKARFIGQVRKGDSKAREIEDVAGEAANAAEMKAAASGNPLILEEMDLRQKLRKLESANVEHDRAQHRVQRVLRDMNSEADGLTKKMPKVQAEADRAQANISKDFTATINGRKLEKSSELGAEVISIARKMMQDSVEHQNIGSYGDYNLGLEHIHTQQFAVIVKGIEEHSVTLDDVDTASPAGTAARIANTIRRLVDVPDAAKERLQQIQKTIPSLEKQVAAWPDAKVLEDAAQRHREVLDQLKPKQKVADPAGSKEPVKNSIKKEPVFEIKGDEYGFTHVEGKEYIRLRTAAQDWYNQNLMGTTVYMADGTPVTFNRRGKRETASGRGEDLLQSVPAIKAIIENGVEVHREAGNQQGVREQFVLVAPINFKGKHLSLAVTMRELSDGTVHYGLNKDNGVDGLNVKASSGTASKMSSLPEMESSANTGINLYQWNPEGKSSPIQKELKRSPLASLLLPLMDNGTIRIVSPADAAGQSVQGWTDSNNNIHLVEGNIPAGQAEAVLLHEAFHTVAPLLGTKAWDQLLGRLSGLYNQFDKSRGKAREFFDEARTRVEAAQRLNGKMNDRLASEEFGAYAIEEYSSAPTSLKKWVDDVLGQVKAWALQRFGRQLGKVSPAQLRSLAIAALKDTSSPRRPDPDGARPDKSERKNSIREKVDQSVEKVTNIRPSGLLEQISGAAKDIQPFLLRAVPLNYFEELAQKSMSAVKTYLRVKRDMDAFRGKKHAVAAATAQEWLSYSKLGKEKVADLANLMHEATLAGADPSSKLEKDTSKPAYAGLRKRFLAMPERGQKLFERVRDDYKRQAEELDDILLTNIQKAYQVAQYRAEKNFRKQMERLADARMDPIKRREAEEEATKAYRQETARARMSMKARLTKMRLEFETNRMEGVYFPLARKGRYYVTVRNKADEVISFSRKERAVQRDRLAKELKADYPDAKIEVGVMEETGGLRDSMDPRMVAEMENILGMSGMPSEVKNDVLDQLWQRYLETMPDLSTRKRYIHRKGTAGFDSDALRSYSSHMFHAAHQMGKLKHGIELQELINIIVDQAKESNDPTKGMTLANEMKARHQWVMNPKGGRLAQFATTSAFVWYLAATPAAAIVNLTQTPMMGIPILGAKFGSMSSAAAALGKASSDILVKGYGRAERIKSLSEDERNALNVFYGSGLIDRTQSHDLAGVGETGVEYSPMRAKVMEKISWAFHNAEVLNREITALAAYRMAKAKGMSSEKAIEVAHELTWKTHFDYSNSSRPRVMQNDWTKVLMVFRSHNVNMIYRVARDIQQSFKGETPAARKEARYQLAGVFGMMALMGGTTGVFGYNLAMTLLGALFGDDDDPFTFEEKFRKNTIDILGTEFGGIALNGAIGHYAGVNLTSRIGMADIWFRSSSREMQGREEYRNLIMDSLGATVSLAGDLYYGASVALGGEPYRGIETASPKALKDLMKAYRYTTEGVVGAGGDEVLPQDALSPWDAIAQAIGFAPAKVAETWERNNTLKNAQKRMQDQRKILLNRFALAVKTEDKESIDKALASIDKFNNVPANKSMVINGKTIQQSLRARERNSRNREDGVLIQNKQLGHDLRLGLPDLIYR